MTPPPHAPPPRRRRSRGVSLITAIFLLVVLAGLGVAMLTISTSQQASASLDLQGARAYQAARAGIEWGLYQQLSASQSCAPSTSFALPPGTSLSAFSVTVTCSATPLAGFTPPLLRYRLVATACNQPDAGGNCPNFSNSPDYVQRQAQAEF